MKKPVHSRASKSADPRRRRSPRATIVIPRVGLGYDIHRFRSGRPLTLGGVVIPSPQGLDGHSDADVLLHAICDALLGAASLGDIGAHFPDTDPAFHNISSLLLLKRVAVLLKSCGVSIVHVDSTLLLERPKIAPYVPQMREAIGDALGIPAGSVSVKATTNEGLGAIGRQEGCAAFAVATVVPSRAR